MLTRNITDAFNKQYDYMGIFSTEIQKLTLTFKDILNKMIAFAESGYYLQNQVCLQVKVYIMHTLFLFHLEL